MALSSYDLRKVYKDIYTIDYYFYENNNYQLIVNKNYSDLIHKYCHYGNTSGKDKCQNNYFKMASSGVIHLLEALKKYNLDDDKLAEYAILWLIYKLNIYSKNTFKNLSDFYNSYIEKNEYYDKNIKGDGSPTYKEIINKKQDLMNMNIKELSKFDAPFYILFDLYYASNSRILNCTNYSGYGKLFVQNFKELNNDPKNIENSSYSQILSTLSNDYKNLKNIYDNDQVKCIDFPDLPPLSPQKISVEKSVDSPGKGVEQTLGESPEATSSSSSILNTVIPGLSTFAIPVFLGVAYKYSLFGIDKIFQRPFIRKKLKNIKKKMKLNI
ncbi:PIR protein CIR protein [Plasmodium vinckei vinckei]|uniref:PIR protein CIR protein n=1 Tax=Plasmodium vinckei vinckei TaxID=54757 RepID=A0A449BMT0_PLAVN|nr:PIR protein CIR protein [Plasmodium vinckei vinckei]VEV54722.1 PIR protein CIR protein [Plasmodium vinckei vinckei]